MSTDPAAATVTPDRTVGDLLRRYPQLAEPLACLVPAYGALPAAVRDAIAGRLTLHELASNGGVPVGPLVADLRRAAGLPDEAAERDVPAWVSDAKRVITLDARPLLAAGAHPVDTVMQGLSVLEPGEVFELLTPFVPAPLIEMARARGFECGLQRDGNLVRSFFRRPGG